MSFLIVFLILLTTSFLQGKLLGEAWKKMSDDDKVEFEELAEQDKKRYQKEMEDYTPPSDDDDDDSDDGGGKKKAKRAKKDPNAPKKPLNAYMLYANSVRAQVREENPDLSVTDVVSIRIDVHCHFMLCLCPC